MTLLQIALALVVLIFSAFCIVGGLLALYFRMKAQTQIDARIRLYRGPL